MSVVSEKFLLGSAIIRELETTAKARKIYFFFAKSHLGKFLPQQHHAPSFLFKEIDYGPANMHFPQQEVSTVLKK